MQNVCYFLADVDQNLIWSKYLVRNRGTELRPFTACRDVPCEQKIAFRSCFASTLKIDTNSTYRYNVYHNTYRNFICSTDLLFSLKLLKSSTECLRGWPCGSEYSVIQGNVKCFTQVLGNLKALPQNSDTWMWTSCVSIDIHSKYTNQMYWKGTHDE